VEGESRLNTAEDEWWWSGVQKKLGQPRLLLGGVNRVGAHAHTHDRGRKDWAGEVEGGSAPERARGPWHKIIFIKDAFNISQVSLLISKLICMHMCFLKTSNYTAKCKSFWKSAAPNCTSLSGPQSTSKRNQSLLLGSPWFLVSVCSWIFVLCGNNVCMYACMG